MPRCIIRSMNRRSALYALQRWWPFIGPEDHSDGANLQVIASDAAAISPDAASSQSAAQSSAGKGRRRLAWLSPGWQSQQEALSTAVSSREPSSQTLWAGVAAVLRSLRAGHAALLQRLAGWTSSLWSVAGHLRSAHTLCGSSNRSTDGVPLPILAQPGVADCCCSSHRLQCCRTSFDMSFRLLRELWPP
jgi:hypothetical protein